jgi:hypothetical protein
MLVVDGIWFSNPISLINWSISQFSLLIKSLGWGGGVGGGTRKQDSV